MVEGGGTSALNIFLKMSEIKAKSTVDAWKMGLRHIIDNGTDHSDGRRSFRQFLNLNVEILKPHEDILIPIKKLSDSNKWVYPDVEEIRSIILAKKRNPSYGFTYGQRIFHFNDETDQVNSYLVPLLKKDKYTRKGVISLWNPSVDACQESQDKPGLVFCMFKVVDNALRVTAVIRDNDYFVGLPANLYQVSVLQDYVAESINVDRGPILIYSLTAHVYKENFEDLNQIVGIRAV